MSTPGNWNQGEYHHLGSVSKDEARQISGNWKEPRPHIRIVRQPRPATEKSVFQTKGSAMFKGPTDLSFNRALITDPTAFAQEANASSWLYLCGEEFASMEGGMSYTAVQEAVPRSANLIADPPREFDMEIARRGVEALDEMPRPTLVTCRTGPRSSALVYLYSGLRSGASADEVLRVAEADGAPFVQMEPLKQWVAQGLRELS